MNKMNALLAACLVTTCLLAQPTGSLLDRTITAAEVTRILQTLSSDAMEGRGTFTPGIDRAAAFIAEEFKAAGLKPAGTNGSYMQSFLMYQGKLQSSKAEVNGQEIPTQDILVETTKPNLHLHPKSSVKVFRIKRGEDFRKAFQEVNNTEGQLLVLVDSSHRKFFNRVRGFFNSPQFAESASRVMVLANDVEGNNYDLQLKTQVDEKKLANVVGILPGKSRSKEYVIFGGHYDHLGIGKPNEKGDSIYNGANDDASGTTAVIMLAKYFQQWGQQERTLIFAAFTGEEMGMLGSSHFSKQYKPEQVAAMFNIEMIGTDSKWGRNSAFITGFDKTDMGNIMQRNVATTIYKFEADPYPELDLFFRSDNATLARQGVPAHTISTSKMDKEPHYHKLSDEISTLDMGNMAEIIKSIALGSRSVVQGSDTPTRVNASLLKR